MIQRLLIANRGEIARRIARTCRDAGITTVSVYTAGDPPTDGLGVLITSYLDSASIVAAAVAGGADAVHPGYGFLSENTDFAQAVLDAGLTWVGPPPAAIAAMGSKIEAKKLMAAAGVPVLPELDPASVTAADLPVLIKASAGGGGRGMRVVRDLASLPAELDAARAEALAAFGDPAVFCEPFLATGRHIEVQLLADGHGTVWTLGERECSIQRRHQKIIEETPSPLVTPAMRARLLDAAVAAATAIGYVGAGTVEFLAADDGTFHFLEMNTRLQVEHPVTEAVTGLDLVAWQLRIAEGAALPASPPPPVGHAIEARIYAEDPAAGWLPQSGTLSCFEVPGVAGTFGPVRGLRLDSGVQSGSVVGVRFDPMLAKLIAWAPSRDEAIRALAGALAGARIHGLTTNRDLLVRVLRHPAFVAGATPTSFLDDHGLPALAAPLADTRAQQLSAVAAALAVACAHRLAAPVLSRLPLGWRNLRSAPHRRSFTAPDGRVVAVAYRFGRDGVAVVEGVDEEVGGSIGVESVSPSLVVLRVGGVQIPFRVALPGSCAFSVAGATENARDLPRIEIDSPLGGVALVLVGRFPAPTREVAAGSLLAPMPGTVIRVAVAEGDSVTAGQPLLWLEAMKMQHQISAPADGVVTHLPAREGLQVNPGTPLAIITPRPETADREQRWTASNEPS
ncbi:propionyl-CoA carboxylase alpha chain [Allocatelliglobosispora scoriae]|uniref:Propionyl-CoA carboxylase alpha chain n=1 Tax=Allocatelliglobosispora scoriae TaxID=643052 RepID=A0A841BVX8_9ACTN|nr:biotin carboxylase N-terminal domain-containing protein [Allocatelliglobosispora scoriae]MBB5873257.1 propionyl-CoA carboxylase alpha chain [Allocatelliglobosispora scoriae]